MASAARTVFLFCSITWPLLSELQPYFVEETNILPRYVHIKIRIKDDDTQQVAGAKEGEESVLVSDSGPACQ